MKEQKKKLPLSLGELIWYSLMGGLGLWGLTYIVLGLVAKYAPVRDADNELLKASNAIEKAFGLGFFYWGLIILAIAAVAAVLVLILFSNKVDRDYEKNARRAQRLAQLEAEEEKEILREAGAGSSGILC